MELPASSCRFGWKELPPTCHHPVLSEGPRNPPSTILFLLRTQVPRCSFQPQSSASAPSPSVPTARPVSGFKLCPVLQAWVSARGVGGKHWAFGSEGPLRVLCFSEATAPSIPWPRAGQGSAFWVGGLDLAVCLWSHPGCAPSPVLVTGTLVPW